VRRLQIGIIGGSTPPKKILKEAEKIGELLGKAGAVVLNGGLGGVMEAVSRGARKYNADVIGIIPYYDRGRCNEHTNIQIATGMGIARNVIIVASSDVVIAINGSWGTLSEIAFAKNLDIPIVGYKISWEFPEISNYDILEEAVEKAIELGELRRDGDYETSSYFS
jgi:hypothetical protein